MATTVRLGPGRRRAPPRPADDEVGRQQDVGVMGEPHDDVRRGPRPHAPQGEQVGAQQRRGPDPETGPAIHPRPRPPRPGRPPPGCTRAGHHTAPAVGHRRGGRNQPPTVHSPDRLTYRGDQARQVGPGGGERRSAGPPWSAAAAPSRRGLRVPERRGPPPLRPPAPGPGRGARPRPRHRRRGRGATVCGSAASGAGRPRRADDTVTSPGRAAKSSDRTSGPSSVRTAQAYRPSAYLSAPATACAERYHVIQGRSKGAGSARRTPRHVRPACRSDRGSRRGHRPPGR